MTDYTLKSLKWRIPDLDNVLIFPKTLSELPELRFKRKYHKVIKSRRPNIELLALTMNRN